MRNGSMDIMKAWLDHPFVRRIRRNHAIEHATVHLISAWSPGTMLGGRADSRGFYIFGKVDSDLLGEAVDAAIEGLENRPGLAVHPFCGTNVLVNGLFAGLASGLVMLTLPRGRGHRVARAAPRLILAGVFAALVGQSAGPWVQARVTTSPDTQGARRGTIKRSEKRGLVIHRIEIQEA